MTSIVDRFLEHSRLFVFSPDDEAQVFLASSDWMPRNFHRRVEVMFPIEAPDLKKRILTEIVPTYLRDNVKARVLASDGSYRRVRAADGQPSHRSQEELLALRSGPLAVPGSVAGNGSAEPAAAVNALHPSTS